MTLKKLSLIAASSACVLALSGCLVPERFSAAVNVQSDGSYAYNYSGTVVHALAAAHIQKAGSLPAKDEADLKAEAAKISKEPDVRRASYEGQGRYNLQVEGKKKAGEALKLLDFLRVSTAKDGVMTIATPELKPRDREGLKEIGIKIDGTLEVKLPRNAEIISHNATSTPSFFGMFGAYSWKIGHLDQRPEMKIRLKK